MSKPTPDLELLRVFDALRPRDYRVRIVNPAGETTYDAVFRTAAEAQLYAKAYADPARDVVMTRHTESHLNN